jgi:hypothetical protein
MNDYNMKKCDTLEWVSLLLCLTITAYSSPKFNYQNGVHLMAMYAILTELLPYAARFPLNWFGWLRNMLSMDELEDIGSGINCQDINLFCFTNSAG